jgi:hypothetical protein
MVLDVFLVLLIAAGGVGVVWWFHRPAYKQRRIEMAMEVRKSTAWGQFTGALVRRWNMTVLPWLRRMWRRFMRRADPAGMKPMSTGGPPRPVPRAAHPLLPDSPAPVAAPVLNGTLIPPDHAGAIARIRGTEFENDAALLDFYRGEMAAFAGHGEAWADHADRLLHEIGLDPAFTHVAAQLADEVGDLAHAFAIVGQRLGQVYGGVQEWVADGGVLPYDARNWLTGEGAA